MNVPKWIDIIKYNWCQPVDDWKSIQIDFTVPVIDSDQRIRIVYRMSMSEWQQGWEWFTADANRVHPYWWYPRVHTHIIDTLDKQGMDFDRETGYAIQRKLITYIHEEVQ